ncbi:unnamed protein product [Amaranthus hypochondriacus]
MGPTGYVFVMLLVIGVVSLKVAHGFHEFNVTIVDDLNQGEELIVRCQSKDTDFGVHKLTETGKSFSWVFNMNVFDSTLYFCHFYWGDKDISFPVFEAHTEGNICESIVNWEVKPAGFYFNCDDDAPILKHTWDH